MMKLKILIVTALFAAFATTAQVKSQNLVLSEMEDNWSSFWEPVLELTPMGALEGSFAKSGLSVEDFQELKINSIPALKGEPRLSIIKGQVVYDGSQGKVILFHNLEAGNPDNPASFIRIYDHLVSYNPAGNPVDCLRVGEIMLQPYEEVTSRFRISEGTIIKSFDNGGESGTERHAVGNDMKFKRLK